MRNELMRCAAVGDETDDTALDAVDIGVLEGAPRDIRCHLEWTTATLESLGFRMPTVEQSCGRAGRLIGDVARRRKTALDHHLKRCGITSAQWWALMLVTQSADGMIQTRLAEKLGIGKVAVGYLVERLLERGLITRQGDESDRRRKHLRITTKGRSVMDQVERVASAVNRKVMGGISDQEQGALIRVLSRMEENLLALNARQFG